MTQAEKEAVAMVRAAQLRGAKPITIEDAVREILDLARRLKTER